MSRLKSVTVKRFKRLSEVKIDLGTTTLLIGANNAGKSSLLQAIPFAVSLAQSAKLVGGVAWRDGKYELSFSQTQVLYCPVSGAMTLAFGGTLRDPCRAEWPGLICESEPAWHCFGVFGEAVRVAR